jgi:acyl carrier protein
MTMNAPTLTPDQGALLRDVIELVEDLSSGWDHALTGAIGPETRLVADLGCESMDIVMLLVAIEGRWERQDLGFDELLTRDGAYVTDLRVREVVEFLARRLPAA